MAILYCSTCGEPMSDRFPGAVKKTVLGYQSPEGHNHDDNCVSKIYECPNGHKQLVSKRNRCPKCDWIGQETCSCHPGKKFDEWPEDPTSLKVPDPNKKAD